MGTIKLQVSFQMLTNLDDPNFVWYFLSGAVLLVFYVLLFFKFLTEDKLSLVGRKIYDEVLNSYQYMIEKLQMIAATPLFTIPDPMDYSKGVRPLFVLLFIDPRPEQRDDEPEQFRFIAATVEMIQKSALINIIIFICLLVIQVFFYFVANGMDEQKNYKTIMINFMKLGLPLRFLRLALIPITLCLSMTYGPSIMSL